MGKESFTAADLASELSAWGTGGGIISMALFPFAIPLLVLTAIAVVPLVLVALVGGLVAAVLALPVLAGRALVRKLRARSAVSLQSGRPVAPA
jgi:hypothetical protein